MCVLLLLYCRRDVPFSERRASLHACLMMPLHHHNMCACLSLAGCTSKTCGRQQAYPTHTHTHTGWLPLLHVELELLTWMDVPPADCCTGRLRCIDDVASVFDFVLRSECSGAVVSQSDVEKVTCVPFAMLACCREQVWWQGAKSKKVVKVCQGLKVSGCPRSFHAVNLDDARVVVGAPPRDAVLIVATHKPTPKKLVCQPAACMRGQSM